MDKLYHPSLCSEYNSSPMLELKKVTGEFPSPRQWRGALMFSLICAWTNGWANNRKAVDSRRHRAHYDVIVMLSCNKEQHSHLLVLRNHIKVIKGSINISYIAIIVEEKLAPTWSPRGILIKHSDYINFHTLHSYHVDHKIGIHLYTFSFRKN